MAKNTVNIDNTGLWREYIGSGSEEARHTLILNYIGLVKYVIYHMSMPENSILEERDFVNIGVIGLCEAIERYDIERGIKFESYAVPRIKGKIRDEMRRLDWLSRTARKKAADLMQATDLIRSEKGREVAPHEIIEKLGITPKQFRSYLEAAESAKVSIALNDATTRLVEIDDEAYDPLPEISDEDYVDKQTEMEREERISFISDKLSGMKEKKRLVISLYYYEELTFKEIGKILDISESRVCQIHTQVIKELNTEIKRFEHA